MSAVATATALPKRERTRQRDARGTQQRVLEATIATLVERGYAATTTLEVQKRAGVSRGALLHHYGSRNELICAAIRYLYQTRFEDTEAQAARLFHKGDHVEATIRMFWEWFRGPIFGAALELWVAARHDPEILTTLLPLEHEIGRRNHELWRTVLGPAYTSNPDFDDVCSNLTNIMRGVALGSVLRSKRSEDRLVSSLIRLATRLLPRSEERVSPPAS